MCLLIQLDGIIGMEVSKKGIERRFALKDITIMHFKMSAVLLQVIQG